MHLYGTLCVPGAILGALHVLVYLIEKTLVLTLFVNLTF